MVDDILGIYDVRIGYAREVGSFGEEEYQKAVAVFDGSRPCVRMEDASILALSVLRDMSLRRNLFPDKPRVF